LQPKRICCGSIGLQAAAEFQAELALVPADADAKYNLGFVYLEQAKVDEAARSFNRWSLCIATTGTSSIRWGRS
jgi:hypothetical protein